DAARGTGGRDPHTKTGQEAARGNQRDLETSDESRHRAAPSCDPRKPIEPRAEGGPEGVEVELIAGRAAERTGGPDGPRVQVTGRCGNAGGEVHEFAFDDCRVVDTEV